MRLVSETLVSPALSDRPVPMCWIWPMTYGETSPGSSTVTLPPVIGKISEPSRSLALPMTRG